MDTSQAAARPDLAALKERQRLGWESGDYARVGVTLQIMAERLVEAAGVRAGQSILDVACGQGNAAMAGARRFAAATGVDYVPGLLVQGRERAAAEHLEVTFTEGDAERLPCAEASHDVTLSTVGVMFAPDQERAAAELMRVTRPGGTIGLASWTPDGLVGVLFRTIGKYAPPPPQVRSPMLWGTPERLRELFGDEVEWVALETRTFEFCYRSPEHFAEWFLANYGPIHRLAGTLDEATRASFAADLAEVPKKFNRADDGTVLAAGEYLEAIGIRR
ncbi:class I SAM-dependent methyltransferase [Nonomuraea sp. 3N208]|uniref:class I SAM-dependent methyltransferase n=1 Tax=Nonomuraea sp. 3N208 TaxID=3457421 RepID=UPI003FCC4858